MESSLSDKIAVLLREGLTHYGEDQVDAAVRAWVRVLELDPGNADARDYIDSIDVVVDAPAVAEEPTAGTELNLLEETLALAAEGHLGDAYSLIVGGLEGQALAIQAVAVMELVRGRALSHYRGVFADTGKPRLAVSAAEAVKFNLPPEASALVLLCDGNTTIADLTEASGLDPFETLHNLSSLVDAGLVSFAAGANA